MGLFDRIWKRKEDSASNDEDHVIAPSAKYASALEAIDALLQRPKEWQWATFEAASPSGPVVIEVSDDAINTCAEPVDLPAIARSIGLSALADAMIRGGKKADDRTLHRVPGASHTELAELVNAIFMHHCKLPADYRVEGYLQD